MLENSQKGKESNLFQVMIVNESTIFCRYIFLPIYVFVIKILLFIQSLETIKRQIL